MSWVPASLQDLCAPGSQLTTCQPSAMLFLSFLASLLGNSVDRPSNPLGSPNFELSSFAYLPQSPVSLRKPPPRQPPLKFRGRPHSRRARDLSVEAVFPSYVSTVTPPVIYGPPEAPNPIFRGSGHERILGLPDEEDEEDALPAAPAVFPAPAGALPQEYDFVIVGAGSAGCVLANRLTEIGHWKVLLLEAGIEEPLATEVPGIQPTLQISNVNWGYRATRMRNACRAWPDGRCSIARGQVMGGSSSIGNTVYLRGFRDDFDGWAAMGNEGWSFDEVLPYFLKSENNRNPEVVERNPLYHNVGGYQSVSWYAYRDPNERILLQAFRERGYRNTDPNAEEQLGAHRLQSTATSGSRQSANIAFVRPIRNLRPNLQIETQAYVTRIIIDPKTRLATGVEYSSTADGTTKIALARKEVIISGGVINTPKLLMLSGIGPSSELLQHGIDVIHESAVGRNLHDHPAFNGFVIVISNRTTTTKTVEEIQQDVYRWLNTRSGPLSTVNLLTVGAYLKTPFEPVPQLPDLMVTFNGAGIRNFVVDPVGALRSGAAFPTAYYDGINIGVCLMAPKSRGYVKLNKTDPVFGPPRLNPRYYEAPPDLDASLAGIRMMQELFKTSAFQANGYRLLALPLPFCSRLRFDSDEYWKCVMSALTISANHAVGTCKMGPSSDPAAVVDPRLRVYGVKGLRVVDSSIMPVIPRAPTNAASIMIGEKGSDMIKEDWLPKVAVI